MTRGIYSMLQVYLQVTILVETYLISTIYCKPSWVSRQLTKLAQPTIGIIKASSLLLLLLEKYQRKQNGMCKEVVQEVNLESMSEIEVKKNYKP